MLVKVCERNFPLFDIYPLRISSRKNSKKTQKRQKHTHTQKGTELFNVIIIISGGVEEKKKLKNKELSEYCNGTKFCVTPKPILTFFFSFLLFKLVKLSSTFLLLNRREEESEAKNENDKSMSRERQVAFGITANSIVIFRHFIKGVVGL